MNIASARNDIIDDDAVAHESNFAFDRTGKQQVASWHV
jgi:delta-aminolevulinic acid dehydratase/porphobilinogen synthase